jgi:hypothetical protein
LKYAVEMGSGAMIYIPSFIKIGSDIHKLVGGSGGCIHAFLSLSLSHARVHTHTHTHTHRDGLISLLFQNEESRLKNKD